MTKILSCSVIYQALFLWTHSKNKKGLTKMYVFEFLSSSISLEVSSWLERFKRCKGSPRNPLEISWITSTTFIYLLCSCRFRAKVVHFFEFLINQGFPRVIKDSCLHNLIVICIPWVISKYFTGLLFFVLVTDKLWNMRNS